MRKMVQPAESNVLAKLDQRPATAFYWQLTLLSTLGGFLFGYDTSSIGSAQDFIPYPLTGFAQGYLVADASPGAAAGPLADRFGRKSLLVADAAIYAAGALLSAFTPNAGVLLAARTLIIQLFERQARAGSPGQGPGRGQATGVT